MSIESGTDKGEPLRLRGRHTFALIGTAVAAIGACAAWCVQAGRSAVVETIGSQGFNLVEIGSFAKARVLRFPSLRFELQTLPEYSAIVGASSAGELLLLASYSGRHESAVHATDRLDLVRMNGRILASVQPNIVGFSALSAELSPNGDCIAFTGALPNPRRFGIYQVNQQGEISTIATLPGDKLPQSMGWSPDGQEFVYDSGGQIFLYHTVSRTTTNLGQGQSPAWSPVSRQISYRTPLGQAALSLPDQLEPVILTGIRPQRGLRWSPNGQYLLYTNTETGDISVLDLQGGETAAIIHGVEGEDESRFRWVKGVPGTVLGGVVGTYFPHSKAPVSERGNVTRWRELQLAAATFLSPCARSSGALGGLPEDGTSDVIGKRLTQECFK